MCRALGRQTRALLSQQITHKHSKAASARFAVQSRPRSLSNSTACIKYKLRCVKSDTQSNPSSVCRCSPCCVLTTSASKRGLQTRERAAILLHVCEHQFTLRGSSTNGPRFSQSFFSTRAAITAKPEWSRWRPPSAKFAWESKQMDA